MGAMTNEPQPDDWLEASEALSGFDCASVVAKNASVVTPSISISFLLPCGALDSAEEHNVQAD